MGGCTICSKLPKCPHTGNLSLRPSFFLLPILSVSKLLFQVEICRKLKNYWISEKIENIGIMIDATTPPITTAINKMSIGSSNVFNCSAL